MVAVSYLDRHRVDEAGCWIWTGYIGPTGYGQGTPGDGYAHRFYYIHMVGPIPKGMEIDHLCRNRSCVNPEHLEAVTRSVNQRRGIRGFALTGLCREGEHDMTNDDDIYVGPNGHRRCRPCATTKRRKYNARRRVAA